MFFKFMLRQKEGAIRFDHFKIRGVKLQEALAVTRGQLEFEDCILE
jgi:hypothetical protein